MWFSPLFCALCQIPGAVFAAFAAFEVFYPRRNKLKKIADGTYEDRFVEFSDTEDIPDFV